MNTYKCTKCNIEKTLDSFYKRKDRPLGIKSECKECTKSSINSRNRLPESKRKLKQYNHEYYVANCTSKIQASKEYYAENREAILARQKIASKAYYQAHRAEVYARGAKRRALKLKQTPPDADMQKIAEFYKESERLTNETGMAHHVDHIMPLSKGGLHHQDNLQVLTATENLKKGAKLPSIS